MGRQPEARLQRGWRHLGDRPAVRRADPARGGAPTLLLGADSGFEDRHPVAVGNLVAFTRTPQYAIQPPQVWIYDKATGTAHKVLDNAQDADISPDGKSLVYTVPGDNDLYTSAIDGTGAAKLTSDGATVQHQTPAWSPTGTRIAFFDGSHSEVLDVASKAETVLAGSGSQPVWQPVNPNAPKPPLPPAPRRRRSPRRCSASPAPTAT
ncbi:DPP IV N-terminal domain-containing protein [Catenulispora yoronensis]